MRITCPLALLCLALLSAPGLGAPAPGEGPDLDAFSWLEGEWIRASGGVTVVESWRRVSEATMEGTVTRSADGTSRVTEHLRLERMGDGVFYTAKPLENRLPTPFELVEWSDGRFVFENPDHDFPQRIVYLRDGDDGLVARIEGPMDGETRSIDFVFERQSRR